jgi:hypothetical protein
LNGQSLHDLRMGEGRGRRDATLIDDGTRPEGASSARLGPGALDPRRPYPRGLRRRGRAFPRNTTRWSVSLTRGRLPAGLFRLRGSVPKDARRFPRQNPAHARKRWTSGRARS